VLSTGRGVGAVAVCRGLHIVGGRVVVAAELDADALARRLRRALGEIYGYPSDVHVLTPGG
jgi:uncharacterized protein (DUF1697 family)